MLQIKNKKWLLAQIKPYFYKIAIQKLQRQGFESFLPKMDKTKREKNKFNVQKVYVFPRYIFVGFNPQIIHWSKINSAYGINKIVAFNNKSVEICLD